MARLLRGVITGVAGFVGSHLAEALLKEGWSVIGFDNLSTGKHANLAGLLKDPHFEFIQGDIKDRVALEAAFRDADVVFHQAALGSVPWSIKDPLLIHENNVNGTLNALLAAKTQKVGRFIYAASSSVYGEGVSLPKGETMPPEPVSPYAVSKYVGELYCEVFQRVYGMETIALRYFNVFGPRQEPSSQYAAVIPKFIAAFAAGTPPLIYGDGYQTRDFVYIDNVVQANILAATADGPTVAGRVFNVGSGEPQSINELFGLIAESFETILTPQFAGTREGDVRHSCADISLARSLLGYEPVIDFEAGLRKTIKWFTTAVGEGQAI